MSELGLYRCRDGHSVTTVCGRLASAWVPVWAATGAWFIGMALGFVIYTVLNRKS